MEKVMRIKEKEVEFKSCKFFQEDFIIIGEEVKI